MGEALPIARERASNSIAANCSDERKPAIQIAAIAGTCKWFIGLSKKLSPNKPAAAIHHLTGEPERTCYEWVRGKFDPPSRAIIKLLHSEVGWIVLEYLMRGCKAAWWIDLQRHRQIGCNTERAVSEAQAQFQF